MPKSRNSTAVVPSRRARLPAAFKHGAFASIQLLPWEDPAAHELLWQELLEEHCPEGALQYECVRDILTACWRKQRLRERQNVEARAALLKPENRVFDRQPAPMFENRREQLIDSLTNRAPDTTAPRDDYEQLVHFSSWIRLDTNAMFVELAIAALPEEYRTHLQTHTPQDKFEVDHLWFLAVKNEVDGVLLPRVRERRPDPDGYLAAAAELLKPDRMIEDLEVEQRLDAQIDRALRRLFWLKTQKKLEREGNQKVVEEKVR